MTKKVIIVNEGGFGDLSAEKGDYNKMIELITAALEEEQKSLSGAGKEKPVEVTVVKTSNEAEEKMAGNDVDIVVFVTRGMLAKARGIKATYPRVKVVVLTGLLPEDEVVLINKIWLNNYRSIRDHIIL